MGSDFNTPYIIKETSSGFYSYQVQDDMLQRREIYVSVILQSITQLSALYGGDNAETIINNCDNCLYLGGQDVETARFMSVKANKTVDTILHMPLDEALLFTRGQRPRRVRKFDLKDHPLYSLLPEAAPCPEPEPVLSAVLSGERDEI